MLIEIPIKGRGCALGLLMVEAVQAVLPRFGPELQLETFDILSPEGKKRFLELSVRLFGEDGVYKKLRLAPQPALYLDGDLLLDSIPPEDELIEALETRTNQTANPAG